MIDDEVRRFARLLEAAVRLSKMSAQQLDRKLGFAQGTLNRIFNGKIELKLRHIFMVCQALGYQPKRFFELAFEPQATSPSPAEQIHSVLQRLGAGGSRLLPAAAPLAEAELDARIEAALQRLGVVPQTAPPEGEGLAPDPGEHSPKKRSPRKAGGANQVRHPKQPSGSGSKNRTS